ncbi:MAG: hypothetical protein KatS3mg076_0122 [Candidatus Binatia bacterium]|nr:MAG: hypothetical protein KatS3mg076_0122 [Candidatus Binatia bacterium]
MPQRILALDLGGHRLRGALVESSFRDYRVARLLAEEAVRDASLAERVRALLSANEIRFDTLLVTPPPELASQRTLVLPFRDRKRLGQTVPFELEANVPFALDEAVVDYQVVHRSGAGSTVLAALVRKKDLQAQLAALAEAGLDPKVVDYAPLASLNVLRTLVRNLPPDHAFLDLTPRDSLVALSREGKLVGVRSVLWPALTGSNGAGPPPLEPLAGEIRWTLMALAEDTLPADLPCILAGDPAEFVAEMEKHLEAAGLRCVRLEELELRLPPGIGPEDVSRFSRPLGLVLREVSPSTTWGLNFRKDEFTYHRAEAELKRSLARTGALAAAWLFLLCANLFVQNWTERARIAEIDARMREIFARTLPDTPVRGDPLLHLRSEVSALEHKLATLADAAPVAELTAIDLLRALTMAVPQAVTIDVDEFTMDPDAVRLRGKTQSFEAVDALKTHFAELPYFKDVQVRDPKTSRDGQGVEFRMILFLRKPGDPTA